MKLNPQMREGLISRMTKMVVHITFEENRAGFDALAICHRFGDFMTETTEEFVGMILYTHSWGRESNRVFAVHFKSQRHAEEFLNRTAGQGIQSITPPQDQIIPLLYHRRPKFRGALASFRKGCCPDDLRAELKGDWNFEITEKLVEGEFPQLVWTVSLKGEPMLEFRLDAWSGYITASGYENKCNHHVPNAQFVADQIRKIVNYYLTEITASTR